MDEKKIEKSEFLKELKDKRYSVILFLMALVTIGGLIKLRNKFQGKVFIVYMSIGSLFGYTWQFFITYMDPKFCGWWYEPHKIWGSIGLISYEDIAFYPICGAFFYFIRLTIPNINTVKNYLLNFFSIIILSIIGITSLLVFNLGGISSTLWFLIPGLFMIVYTMKELNFFRFIFTGIFIVVLASVWDLWIKDWIYITADLNHSKLWLDYASHKWAWIKGSPIEITPWFSISGWVFIYPLAQTCEKIWAYPDLNGRPLPCQGSALTN
jgi:hypothetical protein